MEQSQVDQFISDGYTIFRSLVPAEIVRSLLTISYERRVDNKIYVFGPELFDTDPDLILPIIGSQIVLNVAESIVGPFVQLDSFSVVGVPSGCKAGISWHRDPYGSVPRGGEFQRPLAMNLLIYLQDLVEDVGPLRVIPGSHRRPIVMNKIERQKPSPSERLIHAHAGDGVLIHNNLVHSRTQNASIQDRLHISIVYSLTCMRPAIDFCRPSICSIVAEIRKARNLTFLRLFGEDEFANDRYNSGFLDDEREVWNTWKRDEACVTR